MDDGRSPNADRVRGARNGNARHLAERVSSRPLGGRDPCGAKHGLWQCRQQAHFDGERCELSVWVFPAMKARLRQRAQRDGIALSELVRRFCDQGLRA